MQSSNRGQQTSSGQGQQGQQESQERSLSRRQYFDPSLGFGGDLFRMSPFALLRMMTEQMDRAFAGGGEMQQGRGGGMWAPPVELREKDGNLIVCADLPGIDQKNIKVEVNEDVLTIEGERRREHEENEGGTHRSERSYGRFYRAIQLPEGAQADKAKAEFRDGVLEVKIPVPEPKENRRQIPIQAGTGSTSGGTSGSTSGSSSGGGSSAHSSGGSQSQQSQQPQQQQHK